MIFSILPSRLIPATLLTVWFHSLLFCFYSTARVVINGAGLSDPFFDSIPALTFLWVSVISFAVCASSLVVLLLFRRRTTAPVVGTLPQPVRTHRRLGLAVMAAWLGGLAFWAFTIMWILGGECTCVFDPMFGVIPFLTFMNAGMITFIVSFVGMLLYSAFWSPDTAFLGAL